MTQVLDPNDTGEIHVSAADTAVMRLPEREPAHLRLDEPPIFDLRPARPAHLGEAYRYLDDRPYPPVPPPAPPQPKPSLTDDLLGERPAWAQRGSAGEWPLVIPADLDYLREPQHRRPAPRWTRYAVVVGAWLAVWSAVTLAVLAGVR